MELKEILRFCLEKGIVVESDAFSLFDASLSNESVKFVIEKIKESTDKKIINREFFEKNREKINEFFLESPKEHQKCLNSLKLKLGVEIEISRKVISNKKDEEIYSIGNEKSVVSEENKNFNFDDSGKVSIISEIKECKKGKRDFKTINFLRLFENKFDSLKKILQERPELKELISISNLNQIKQKASIICMIYDKKTTKNNNILLEVEDFTGRMRVLVNYNNKELYSLAENLVLDSVVGFSGFGDREIFFANKLILPDISILEKKYSPKEEAVIFLGDLHFGSKLFLKSNFLKLIDYLNSENIDAKKIKYIFLVGDIVSGIGNYPGQINDLEIKNLEEQFSQLAKQLSKIRKEIKIIISPGNHDGVRLLEPQPCFDEKYAWPLYDLPNVVVTTNPSTINIGCFENFGGFNVLVYHGFSYPFYSNNVPELIEGGLNAPDKIMTYLLKNRHLAPAYSSTQQIPSDKDNLVIREVPDIFVSGHSHKLVVNNYKGVLLISTSTWESETEYQKRKGNLPDFCKVPMFNLKTRSIKILDFE